jgi:hypothetical protein
MEKNLTSLGLLLQDATTNIVAYDKAAGHVTNEEMLHVPNTGNGILFAYEQLRNVSENIENHLLFQSAIARFYKRNLSFGIHRVPEQLSQELVIELTQAEYLENDTTPMSKLALIDSYITQQYSMYWKLLRHDKKIKPETAQKWVLNLLTVQTEQVFNNPIRVMSFAALAYTHFNQLITVADFVLEGEKVQEADHAAILYIAIHKALLKSNDANVRSGLFSLYNISEDHIAAFSDFNKKVDTLTALKTTAKVSRLVSRNGASLRVLQVAFFKRDSDAQALQLDNKSHILGMVGAQVTEEYAQVRRTVNKGIIKSIIFLLITKALIGLVVEIPYDLAVTGMIVLMPLIINLVFPPVFIAITALTFKMPSEANKKAIVDYVESMLYQSDHHKPQLRYTPPPGRSYFFDTVYVIMFLVVFYFVADRLAILHFNIIQGVIFFVFLSTASFLGYRLTVQIKELEIISRSQGFITLIRDFLYAPFIFVGQKISYRFARMNIIAQILDIVIELPLKSVLRLLRQWSTFLNNKKDELL